MTIQILNNTPLTDIIKEKLAVIDTISAKIVERDELQARVDQLNAEIGEKDKIASDVEQLSEYAIQLGMAVKVDEV